MNDEENDKFHLLIQQSGVENISRFIPNALFGKEIKVVKVDKATMHYYVHLTNFYHQFQAIGNNYNQTIKALITNFQLKKKSACTSLLSRKNDFKKIPFHFNSNKSPFGVAPKEYREKGN